MTQRIPAGSGVTQVVKLRMDPSPAQVEVLRGCCGTARAVYNILLFRARADLGQRAAERSYGIGDPHLTQALSWHRFSLEKLLRENREEWLPWWGRRELGAVAAGKLSRVHAVKDNRARKAAKQLRDGHAQVQTVTYSFSGGYWWAALRLRVLPTYATRSDRRRPGEQRVEVVGVDAGLGKHFATLGTPVDGLTDPAGHPGQRSSPPASNRSTSSGSVPTINTGCLQAPSNGPPIRPRIGEGRCASTTSSGSRREQERATPQGHPSEHRQRQ